jgi:hypothetical protein
VNLLLVMCNKFTCDTNVVPLVHSDDGFDVTHGHRSRPRAIRYDPEQVYSVSPSVIGDWWLVIGGW